MVPLPPVPFPSWPLSFLRRKSVPFGSPRVTSPTAFHRALFQHSALHGLSPSPESCVFFTFFAFGSTAALKAFFFSHISLRWTGNSFLGIFQPSSVTCVFFILCDSWHQAQPSNFVFSRSFPTNRQANYSARLGSSPGSDLRINR